MRGYVQISGKKEHVGKNLKSIIAILQIFQRNEIILIEEKLEGIITRLSFKKCLSPTPRSRRMPIIIKSTQKNKVYW
jgi:hypothetical protein